MTKDAEHLLLTMIPGVWDEINDTAVYELIDEGLVEQEGPLYYLTHRGEMLRDDMLGEF